MQTLGITALLIWIIQNLRMDPRVSRPLVFVIGIVGILLFILRCFGVTVLACVSG